jgi:hypothetical protein
MWLLFQMLVMIAILCTGIYYEWTPNPVALGIVAVAGAWLATKALSFRGSNAEECEHRCPQLVFEVRA